MTARRRWTARDVALGGLVNVGAAGTNANQADALKGRLHVLAVQGGGEAAGVVGGGLVGEEGTHERHAAGGVVGPLLDGETEAGRAGAVLAV